MKFEDSSPIDSSVEQTKQQDDQTPEVPAEKPTAPAEIGGRKNGLDPTRYGDWEKNGRCIDF